ncbi:hypothetical protein TH25_18105 [Thalassospira profundimaris]|uniref:TPM domain-containing protein n=1 Tax=Thalassospira profundimaris TaxID=502049 RepID=A0A367WXM0_9PROT|nr:TPM domain-containing protein [Thalassospira profundimaris]RCK45251.1 hypothetical protein TH25_18105 [Thalassospira profundimaris]
MKSVFMLLLLSLMLTAAGASQAAPYERKTRYVNDYASLFTPEKRASLNETLAEVEQNEAVEISILTVDKLPATEQEIDDLADRTLSDWHMGDPRYYEDPRRKKVLDSIFKKLRDGKFDADNPAAIIQEYMQKAPPYRLPGRAILMIFSKEDNAVRLKSPKNFGVSATDWKNLNTYHFEPIFAHNDIHSAIDAVINMVLQTVVHLNEYERRDYISVFSASHYFPLKRYDRYVNDYAHLLSPGVKAEIAKKLKDYDEKTGTDVSVLTVKSTWSVSSHRSWESFSTAQFNVLNIGGMKSTDPDNMGVLLIVSQEDRKVRIELGAGYGGIYDTVMQDVIDNIVPALHDENYDAGIAEGVRQIISTTQANITFWEWYKWHLLAAGVVLLSLAVAIRNRFQNYVEVHWLIAGAIGAVIIFVCLKLVAILSAIPAGNGIHYPGGFGGGGGGGFGGGGGGGGGGASGSF